MLTTTNSFAWRTDISLSLPGTKPTNNDVVDYLIFSKDLLSEQNKKMHPNNVVVIPYSSPSGN